MDLDPPEAIKTELMPCPICGRTFRPDALARHQRVCEKNASKKRKVFDSSKQRAPEELKEIKSKPQPKKQATKVKKEDENKNKPKALWREKHEELIRTIKAARGENVEDSPNHEEPKKKVPSDYELCPGCGRYFNQRAAERHVPWCQKKKSEAQKSGATDEAKEKLIARIRYRPPQGKSRLHRKTKTAGSLPVKDIKKTHQSRDQGSHSSPPTLLDNRNARNNKWDRINNNVAEQNAKNSYRSGSQSREKEMSPNPDLPHHIIKFKEKFPNHIYKRNVDLEESLTAEQLRELLSVSRITDRIPRTVPGVRLSRERSTNRNDGWGYKSTDVSRSASSSGGSTNSWNNRLRESTTLPEVSSSELPGTWMTKLCWNGDLDRSLGSTGSSGSSSNGSLPPLSRESAEEAPVTFYCHQCNSRFPLVGAKYCCECGAKRRGAGQMCISQTG